MIEAFFYPTQYECKKYIEMGKQYKEELIKILEAKKSTEK